MENGPLFYDYTSFLDHLVKSGDIRAGEAQDLLDAYKSHGTLDFGSLAGPKAELVQRELLENWTKVLNAH